MEIRRAWRMPLNTKGAQISSGPFPSYATRLTIVGLGWLQSNYKVPVLLNKMVHARTYTGD